MTIIDIMNTQLAFKLRGNMRKLHPTLMPLWSLIKGIESNAKLLELTEYGRTLEKPDYKKWKPRNLMAVYFGAKFRDSSGASDLVNVSGYTGLAGFDFDNVEVAATMGILKSIPQVTCVGISASGKGVWAIAHVAAATDPEYRMCFAEAIKTFKEAGVLGIDYGCHDPTRARFVVADPNCWWRYDATDDIPAFPPTGDLLLLGNPDKKRRKKVKTPTGYHMSPELAFDAVREILSEVPDLEVGVGERNNEMARMCGKLKSLANNTGVNIEIYAAAFTKAWDAVGYEPKRTRSMVNRLLAKDEVKK